MMLFIRKSPREGRKSEDENDPGPKNFESYKIFGK
jgi:hypothetical protein